VKRLLVLLVPALAVTVPLATAQARTSSPEATDASLTSICHRTSSARRPYVKLRVTARQRTAHLRHAADIIPAGRGACPRTILSPTSAGTALRIFMTGEADVPAGDPVGTGEATIRLRRGQGQICYSLEVQNITLPSVGAHIHHGGAGESGPIVVPLRQPGANGQSSGCATVSRALVSQILVNRSDYYVNVHTTDFPGGAVRGQLTGTTEADLGRTMTVTLNGASECNAAGTCNLGDLDGAGTTVFRFRSGNVCYRVRVSNIRLPSVGTHIHRGTRTSAGPIIVQMTAPDASGVSSGCTATAQTLIDEILATPANFYNNVHTTDFPAGAIRGALG
jgi:CHRD domain-containing protein